MLKKIALGLGLVFGVTVVGILGVAATKPDSFRFERSVIVNAPAEKIYPIIADFHAWSAWSPFEKMDPTMKKTYSGAPSGLGAIYNWDGDGHSGAGRMEIVEAKQPFKILIKLDFTKPMTATNDAIFTMVPENGGTKVTWAMEGKNDFVNKLMSVFMSMDAMIGKEFESGLASIKQIAEK